MFHLLFNTHCSFVDADAQQDCDDNDCGTDCTRIGDKWNDLCSYCFEGVVVSIVYVSVSEGIQVKSAEGNLIRFH